MILQTSPTAIVFPKSTGIKKLTDLYGKRLGLQLKSAVKRQWRVVAKMANIDTSKINEVPADLAVAQLIIAGRIDAGVAFFFNDGIRPIAEGIDMDWILFRDVGLPMYSSSLTVNAATIEKKPDLVARFTRAFLAADNDKIGRARFPWNKVIGVIGRNPRHSTCLVLLPAAA